MIFTPRSMVGHAVTLLLALVLITSSLVAAQSPTTAATSSSSNAASSSSGSASGNSTATVSGNSTSTASGNATSTSTTLSQYPTASIPASLDGSAAAPAPAATGGGGSKSGPGDSYIAGAGQTRQMAVGLGGSVLVAVGGWLIV